MAAPKDTCIIALRSSRIMRRAKRQLGLTYCALPTMVIFHSSYLAGVRVHPSPRRRGKTVLCEYCREIFVARGISAREPAPNYNIRRSEKPTSLSRKNTIRKIIPWQINRKDILLFIKSILKVLHNDNNYRYNKRYKNLLLYFITMIISRAYQSSCNFFSIFCNFMRYCHGNMKRIYSLHSP